MGGARAKNGGTGVAGEHERNRSIPLAGRKRRRARDGVGARAKRAIVAGSAGRSALPQALSGRASHRSVGKPHPVSANTRRRRLQLLAGRQSRAGDLAAHLAAKLPERFAVLDDRTRFGCAREARTRKLGVERRRLRRAAGTALHDFALGRRRRRRDDARVRPFNAQLRAARIRSAARKADHRMGRRRHTARVASLAAGSAHALRLRVRRQTITPRTAAFISRRNFPRQDARRERESVHAVRRERTLSGVRRARRDVFPDRALHRDAHGR